jgi:TPR repeat protein
MKASGCFVDTEIPTFSNFKEKEFSRLHILKIKANNGDPKSAFTLGNIYLSEGDEYNIQLSKSWFKVAYKLGMKQAKVVLLSIKLLKDKNYSVINEIEKMSLNGNPIASYHLGVFYDTDAKNLNKKLSEEYYLAGANKGHAKSQYNLSIFYKNRNQDAKYIELLTESARCHFDKAIYQLGLEYFSGERVLQNINIFKNSMESLVNMNHTESMITLGTFYIENAQSLTDYYKAEEVLFKSIKNGNETYKEWLITFYNLYLSEKSKPIYKERLMHLKKL